MRSCDRRRVATLRYDGLSIFEFGIVVEIFGLPRPELEVDWYKFETCSHQRGPLRTTGGVRVEARHGLRTLQQAGTIVISGWKRTSEPPPESLLKALRSVHARGARLVSIVPEPSFLRPPACSMASTPPPTGVTRKSWLSGFRRFASTPAFCTWMKAAF